MHSNVFYNTTRMRINQCRVIKMNFSQLVILLISSLMLQNIFRCRCRPMLDAQKTYLRIQHFSLFNLYINTRNKDLN